MQHVGAHQEPAQNLEMSLREHLLAAGASDSQQHTPYPPPPSNSNGAPSSDNPYQPSGSDSPHDHHLDPTMSAHTIPYAMSSQHTGDSESMQPTPKGKRELSTSKRAAQNRAAQRAFRQRKEGYIKKLEEQVKDYEQMEQNFRALQNENFQLREYILILQTRLLETKGELPAAPPEVRLTRGVSPGSAEGESLEPSRDDGRRALHATVQADGQGHDDPRERDTDMTAAVDIADVK